MCTGSTKSSPILPRWRGAPILTSSPAVIVILPRSGPRLTTCLSWYWRNITDSSVRKGTPMRRLSLLALLVAAFPALAAEPSWPAFRGGPLAGVGDKPLPAVWGKDKNLLWQTDIPGRGWSSPVVWGDKVFVTSVVTDGMPPDPRKGLYIEELTGKTPPGEHRWRVERDEKSNWATPFVWKNEQRTEIVTAGTKRVRSYDLDGKVLWELSGMSVLSIPTPFAADGLLYVTSGYVLDPVMKPVYAIKP